MQFHFPPAVQRILKTLQEGGYEGYVVGGAVRDVLMQKPVNDWDFTTNATPEQIQALFKDSFYDNQFGTVGIAGKHLDDLENPEAVYEITTFRSESAYSDHRRPDSVEWGKTLLDDLQRRDFSMNAMALAQDDIIDPFHGQEDLKNGLIKAVGDPEVRFHEDALRMMRAVRFGAQLGFFIEPATLQAIHSHAADIQHVSWERIRDEFLKILVSPYSDQAIQLLQSTGILQYILPELLAGRGQEQAHHHIYDVWTHSINALKACPSQDPIVKFAALLHDIAKPATAAYPTQPSGEKGLVTFYNHEVVGARMAKAIAQRFKLSKKDVDRIFSLVRWHMFVYDENVTDAYIRRFIKRVGVENIQDMIDVRIGDRLGSGASKTSWRLEEMQARIQAQLVQPFSLRDLEIDGNVLMQKLGLKPGPQLGKILNQLFEEVLDDPTKNTAEYLEKRAAELSKE